MKKISLLVLSFLMVLIVSACQPSDKITVIIPKGSPAMASLYIIDNDSYQVDLVNGAEALQAAFVAKDYDVIVAPTNLGATMYNNNQAYVFAGAINFGNNYLVASQETPLELSSLQGKEIIAFGKNATPDAILSYVLKESNIQSNISYLTSVDEVATSFLNNKDQIALMAEPKLSALQVGGKIENLQILDLQEAYKTITGKDSYPQAGVFVKSTINKNIIRKIQKAFNSTVVQVLEDIEKAADLAVKLELGFPKPVLLKAIPKSHIDFKESVDVKEELIFYYNILLNMNPNLIGKKLPEDAFYF